MANEVPMEQQAGFDIRDSDVKMWENYTIRKPQPDGSMRAALRSDMYPAGWDDKEISGVIKGDNARQMMQAWFGYVKGRINAWESRKEAEALKRAETLAASRQREVATAGILTAGPVAPAIYIPDREASLESILESKVVAIRGRLSGIETTIANALGVAAASQQQKSDLTRELRAAERALAVVGDTRHDPTRARASSHTTAHRAEGAGGSPVPAPKRRKRKVAAGGPMATLT